MKRVGDTVQDVPTEKLMMTIYKHTYIDHIHLHGVWNILPQGISGNHGDVIVDPKWCVIFVEETRVLARGSVIWALVDRLWAENERYQQTLHLLTTT